MRQIQIGDRIITDDDVFIIAEIGANHMGNPDLCEKMIIKAAQCGVDAVKMQRRDRSMLTKTERNRPYENENSFGKTYGEHRDFLDYFGGMSDAELFYAFVWFKALAEKQGVLFFATPFTFPDVDFLNRLNVDLWKVASCDARNFPMVQQIAKQGKPVLISTGGSNLSDTDRLVFTLNDLTYNYSLLHCVSTYPNTDENVNLNAIKTLRERYPDVLIGFSSHHPGLPPLLLARQAGASIFEMHFTLNRSWKGTDQSFSLEPKGLAQAVEDIKRVRVMLGSGVKEPTEVEKSGFIRKMGKGMYLSHGMIAGDVVNESDIIIKAPAGELRPDEAWKVIGHPLLIDVSTGVDLREEMLGN